MTLAAGHQLAQRYRLTRRIAVGGMGEVWEAADVRLNRPVAVKVLKGELGDDHDFLERFRHEARTTASINHVGIAAVHDYGEEADADAGAKVAFLVMELVRGEPLSARLATNGRLTPKQTLDLLQQAGRALEAAHDRGFVHRDVKPGNILLAEDGTVKLTDFGIAKAAADAPVTQTGMVMGTAHYIAPEHARGAETGPAGDVYSLGVVGYECLSGRRPFGGDTPVAIATKHIEHEVPPLPDDVPPLIRELIENALVKEPGQRYADGGEFAAAIAAVGRGDPPPAPRGRSGAYPAVSVPVPPRNARQVGPVPAGTGVHRIAQIPVPTRGGGRTLLAASFVVLTVAAVMIGVFVVRDAMRPDAVPTPAPAPADSPEPPPGSSPSPARPVPGIAVVNPDTYLGRSAAAVLYELQSAGLRTSATTTRGERPSSISTCTVTDVNPSGTLAEGATVAVTCEQG